MSTPPKASDYAHLPQTGGSGVYVVLNDSLPGLVKIGRSLDVTDRVKKLWIKSVVPTPYVAAAVIETPADLVRIECEIHNALSDLRVSRRSEFFRCDSDEALQEIITTARRIAATVTADYVAEVEAEGDDCDPPFISGGDVLDDMNRSSRPDPIFVTAEEAAYYLGISRSSVFNMMKTGELKHRSLAGRKMIPFAELRALAETDPTPEELAAAEKRTRRAAAAIAVRRKRRATASQDIQIKTNAA